MARIDAKGAVLLLRQALGLQERSLKPSDLQVAATLVTPALTLQQAGTLDESESLLWHALLIGAC